MIETAYARRYKIDPNNPWALPIQLKRTELKWSYDQGFQMSGIWSGALPQNGIYRFEPQSRMIEPRTNKSVLDGLVLPMVCTFSPDGTWGATDFYFQNEIPGLVAGYGTEGHVQRSAIDSCYYAFHKAMNAWLGNMNWTAKTNENVWHDYGDTITQAETFKVSNPTFPYITVFGGKFFAGYDSAQGDAFNHGDMNINFNTLSGGNIQQMGALDRPIASFGYSTDNTKWEVSGIYPSPEGYQFKTDQTASKGFVQLSRAFNKGASDMNKSPSVEGKLTEYKWGVPPQQPNLTEISMHGIIMPTMAFQTEYRLIDTWYGFTWFVKAVDFYEQQTTLMQYYLVPQ